MIQTCTDLGRDAEPHWLDVTGVNAVTVTSAIPCKPPESTMVEPLPRRKPLGVAEAAAAFVILAMVILSVVFAIAVVARALQ